MKVYYAKVEGLYEIRRNKNDMTDYVLVTSKCDVMNWCHEHGYKPRFVLGFKAKRIGKGVC